MQASSGDARRPWRRSRSTTTTMRTTTSRWRAARSGSAPCSWHRSRRSRARRSASGTAAACRGTARAPCTARTPPRGTGSSCSSAGADAAAGDGRSISGGSGDAGHSKKAVSTNWKCDGSGSTRSEADRRSAAGFVAPEWASSPAAWPCGSASRPMSRATTLGDRRSLPAPPPDRRC